MVQALTAGKIAGLNVPEASFTGASKFLDSVAAKDNRGYGYQDREASQRMTAVGTLSRQRLGWKVDDDRLWRHRERLRVLSPTPDFWDMYYYFYATQVVHHMGGEPWEQWNEAIRELLLTRQDQGKSTDKRDQKGSWDPTGDDYKDQFGRLGQTALYVLTLEVYYRYVPLYRRDR